LSLWSLLDDPVTQPEARCDLQAWWKTLDNVSRYDELDATFDFLNNYIIQYGPFDGVVGFSQGATLAIMLVSLCEATSTRIHALDRQGAPLRRCPPQAPFKFVIAVSGFIGTQQYYSGFYHPMLSTPSLHVIAEWDTMVEARHSEALAIACENSRVIRHVGAHVFPTSGSTLGEMVKFIQNSIAVRCCNAAEEVSVSGHNDTQNGDRCGNDFATSSMLPQFKDNMQITLRSSSDGSWDSGGSERSLSSSMMFRSRKKTRMIMPSFKRRVVRMYRSLV